MRLVSCAQFVSIDTITPLVLFTPSGNYLCTPNFLISWWHWRALRRWFCGGFLVVHYCVSITERSTPLHTRSLPSLFITIKHLIWIFAMLNPGSKMLTGCGLNYKTFVQISFLIFQFDHFGRWVPKKYFTLICYDSRNTIYSPWQASFCVGGFIWWRKITHVKTRITDLP